MFFKTYFFLLEVDDGQAVTGNGQNHNCHPLAGGGRALKTADNNQITMTSDMKQEKLLFLVFEQVEHSQRPYGSIFNYAFFKFFAPTPSEVLAYIT